MATDPLLEEYKLCSLSARHLDEQNWMWGSFLFGGSIAGAGFVLSSNPTGFRLLALSLLSTVILVGYVSYVDRSNGIREAYFSRMREIEATRHPEMVIERRLHHLTQHRTLPNFDEIQPIRLAPIRAFDVLRLMVTFYLVVLYGGTLILAITKGFTIP